MASIHRDTRGKSPYWYCAFGLPNGKRAFRSTKQSDRKSAQDICREWEKAADKASRGELTEAQGRKVLDSILEAAGEKPIRVTSTRNFFENWLVGKKLAKKVATGARYATTVSLFLEAIGERAEKPLAALSPADVEVFRDRRTADGVALSTVRMDLKIVRGILSTARRQGLILHNPAEAVELPLATVQGRDVFQPEEVRRLIDLASPDWNTAILIAYYTGARLGDVVSLTWENVDLERGAILLRQTKTGRTAEIPIHSELQEHLFSIAGDNPKGHLCPLLARQKIAGRSGLSLQFAKLMGEAGIDQRQMQISEARKFSTLSFHSLRHSFTSALANAGVAPDLRMKLTGHLTADVHARYSHHDLETLKAAVAMLPGLTSGKD